MRGLTPALALCWSAALASAQPQIFVEFTGEPVAVEYSLEWTEVDALGAPVGSADGVLAPGEAARISVSVAMSHPIGTAVYWQQGSWEQHGTLYAFMAFFVDLAGPAGTWAFPAGSGVRPEWDLIGEAGWGTADGDGAVMRNIQAGQFGFAAYQMMSVNPVMDLWTAVWRPNSYDFRTLTWNVENGSANPSPEATWVMGRDSQLVFVPFPRRAANNFGSLTINMIPAPGAGAFVLAAAFRGRHRPARRARF